MTLISPRRKPPLRGRGYVLAGVIVLLIVGIWALRQPLSGVAWSLWQPLFTVRSGVGNVFLHIRAQVTDKAFLQTELMRLSREYATTSLRLADRDALAKENAELKARLGRSSSQETILAAVIGKPPLLPYDLFVIDAGSDQGVAEGQWVSAGGTTLIGRVTAVYQSSAQVTLFSKGGETLAATIRLSDGTFAPLTLTGQGGGALVSELPVGAPVHVGDELIIPSINGGYVASVSNVDLRDGESFVTVYTHLDAGVWSLPFVEVWRK